MSDIYQDEQQLIDDLLIQKSEAYRYLVETYYLCLYRVAVAIAGKEDAEGIVQDAWILIIKALPKFERRASLKTWMSRIVANESKRRLRKSSREVTFDDLGDDSFLERFNNNGHWNKPAVEWDFSTPEQILEESQLKRCIEATLAKLPQQQQAVFSLRYLENYSLNAICNILEVSDSNVRVILHRGRNKLLETIERFQVTGEC